MSSRYTLSHVTTHACALPIKRNFTDMDRIEINPAVCNGKPVIRNTRIAVQTVLSHLSADDSVDDVLAAHPRLAREDVLACLAYARRLSELHTTVALAS